MKRTIVFFIVFFFMSLNGFSQEKSQLRFNSLGLKIGWYNPSLDYWKNESEFKNADFNGGFYNNRISKSIGIHFFAPTTPIGIDVYKKLLLVFCFRLTVQLNGLFDGIPSDFGGFLTFGNSKDHYKNERKK
jgi:hypothetical protein